MMMKQWLTWLVAAVLAWPTGLPISRRSPSTPSPSPRYATGIVLVGLAPGRYRAALAGLEKELGARLVAALPQVNAAILQAPPGKELHTASLARQNPAVVFAEPDYAVSADEAQMLRPAPASRPQSFPVQIPNDPFFNQQWSLTKIGAPFVWNHTTGSANVLVAIVDSGVQISHPDLADKIWTNPGEIPGNLADDDGNGKVDDLHGWHFYHRWTSTGYEPAEDANPNDDFGHGTHVAGIAAAKTNNQAGIAGLSWEGRILPVKVLDEYGNGWYSDIAAGIIYATDNAAQIINLSLGGESPSELLLSAVEYAHSHGALVIAAAGNTGGAVYYPAAYDSVIAVAATDQNDERPFFSNFGPQIDLAAPGKDIYSTWYLTNYFTKSGTSMAAPHVSGVAALLWSRQPDLTAAQVAQALMESAVDVGAPGKDEYTGWGRLSANRAFGLLPGFSDLWVKSNLPDYVRPGQFTAFTVTCGNKGLADVTDTWITSTLTLQSGAVFQSGWLVQSLPASGNPITYTTILTAGPPGSVLTHTIEITSLLTETNPLDNADQKQATAYSVEVFLPLAARP